MLLRKRKTWPRWSSYRAASYVLETRANSPPPPHPSNPYRAGKTALTHWNRVFRRNRVTDVTCVAAISRERSYKSRGQKARGMAFRVRVRASLLIKIDGLSRPATAVRITNGIYGAFHCSCADAFWKLCPAERRAVPLQPISLCTFFLRSTQPSRRDVAF